MGEIFFVKFEEANYCNVQLKNNCKFTYWAFLSLREIYLSLIGQKLLCYVGWQPNHWPLTLMSNWICWYLEALNNILFSPMSEINLILLFQFLKAQTDWPSNNCCEFSVCFLCPDPLLVRCCWVSWLRGRQVQIPRNNGKLCRPEGQLQDPLRMPKP